MGYSIYLLVMGYGIYLLVNSVKMFVHNEDSCN